MIVHHEFLNNEIHVKIGGDHGGGSLKFSLQIVNTVNPNSKDNAIIFSIFEAKDYTINILAGMQRLTKQVEDLQEISWR